MAVRRHSHKPDTSLLKEDEVEKIKSEARTQWEEEMRGKQRRDLLQAEKAMLDRKADPEEEIVENVQIDLPPFADRVVLDQTIYLHGTVHDFPMRQYRTIREVMSRAWAHEDETKGRKSDERRGRGFTLSGTHGVVNTVGSLARR